LKFLNGFRIAMVVAAAWSALAYAFYFHVISVLPLLIGPLVASTVLFPGAVSHMIIVNAFKVKVGFGPLPIYAYVPNPFTETLGAVLSVLISLAFAFSLWRIFKAK